LTVNTLDIQKMIDNIGLYKVDQLFIILENDIEISEYIRTLKKVKSKVTIAIKDIFYLTSETANKLKDRLNVDCITILDYDFEKEKNIKYCYSIEDYVEIRNNFDFIINQISNHYNDMEKFNELYEYLKKEIDYDEEAKDLKDFFVYKKSSQNLFASAINSCLLGINLKSKIIVGEAYDEKNKIWNQVQIDNTWYNFDLGSEVKAKYEKKIIQYIFKGNLFNDEKFYKTHVPLYGNPEKCDVELNIENNEVKNSIKKISFFKKIYYKIKFILKNNKALSAPSDEEK